MKASFLGRWQIVEMAANTPLARTGSGSLGRCLIAVVNRGRSFPMPCRNLQCDLPRPTAPFGLHHSRPLIGEVTLDPSATEEESEELQGIRCPLCGWVPKSSSRWMCVSCPHPEGFTKGCWTTWNTFDTRGQCPGCGHQWRWTACLHCEGWSLHEHWYTNKA
jgi:hypothetical protein